VGITAKTHMAVNHALNMTHLVALALGRKDLRIEKIGESVDPVTSWGEYPHVPILGSVMDSVVRQTPEEDTGVSKSQRDVVLVDEAGQIPFYALACINFWGERFILFGDDDQLPPILKGKHDTSHNLTMSALSYLGMAYGGSWVPALTVTQRLNQMTTELLQKHIYPAICLTADRNARSRIVPSPKARLLQPQGIQLIQVDSMAYRYRDFNPEELTMAKSLIQEMLGSQIATDGGALRLVTAGDIIFLSPFKWQCRQLKVPGVIIGSGTVDRLQGQDKSLIIFSATVSCPHWLAQVAEWYFHPNRWNVAISRAKAGCVILADMKALRACKPSTLLGIKYQQKVLNLLGDIPTL
jgi:hypothetical protein